MPVLRSTSVVAMTAAALALTGCGSSPEKAAGAPDSSTPTVVTGASETPSPTTPTTAAATPTGTATDTPTTADCGPGVPDGTWTGPIVMDVDGKGGQTGFGSSVGSGSMKLVVAKGKVTSGTWHVRWKSQGHADTGQAAATIKLDGTIRGGAQGPATKPLLSGTWSIRGTATITKPVHSTAPVAETGKDSETMAISSVTCDTVEGSFLPSFNSKDAAATFTGTARWAGARQG